MVSLNQKRKIFRDVALDQANSPEQLDRLIQVTSPRRWLSLAAFTILVSSGTAWSLMAKIPTTVTGKGILVYPSTTQTVQSNTGGPILEVKVKSNDVVKKGQVLATIDQSDLKLQLQLAEVKRDELKRQDRDADDIRRSRERFDQIAALQERQALQNSLETARSTAPVLGEKGLDSIQRERTAFQEQLRTLTASLPTAKTMWDKRQSLYAQGIVTEDVAVQARKEYEGIQSQMNQVEVQLKQLDTKEAESRQQTLNNLNQLNSIQAKIEGLDSQKVGKTEQDAGASRSRQKEIADTDRTIAQLTTQLQKKQEIISTQDGTFLEVTVKPGQRIEPGGSIGTISIRRDADKLQNLVFLDPTEAKKVEGAVATARQQEKDKKIEVKITPTTVKVEEYGGIIGEVQEVSSLAMTPEAATNLVGNPNMLKGVIAENTQQIVIRTSLTCDDAYPQPADCQKYKWSGSKGNGQALTPGTTTNVRITIAERAPITYILPFLEPFFKTITGKQS
jgi:HlyD family secretion protein